MSAVLSVIAMSSLTQPETKIKKDATLPKSKRIKTPMSGEKRTGTRIGRSNVSLIDLNGENVSPRRVLVQMYPE